MFRSAAFLVFNVLGILAYGQLYSVQHAKHVLSIHGELPYYSIDASNNKAVNSSVVYNPTGYQGFGIVGTLVYEFNLNPTWGFLTGIGIDHKPGLSVDYTSLELNSLMVPIRVMYRGTTSFALEGGIDLGIPLAISPANAELELSNLETSAYFGIRFYSKARWISGGLGYRHGLTEWGTFTGEIGSYSYKDMNLTFNEVVLSLRFRLAFTREDKVVN